MPEIYYNIISIIIFITISIWYNVVAERFII